MMTPMGTQRRPLVAIIAVLAVAGPAFAEDWGSNLFPNTPPPSGEAATPGLSCVRSLAMRTSKAVPRDVLIGSAASSCYTDPALAAIIVDDVLRSRGGN
jgi:hypothetical protein